MRNRGFALIAVLWGVAFGGLYLAVFSERASFLASLGLQERDLARAKALANTGFARSISVLTGVQHDMLRDDGLVWLHRLSHGELALRIVSSDCLFDLNNSAPNSLFHLSRGIELILKSHLSRDEIVERIQENSGNFSSSLDLGILFADYVVDRDQVFRLAGLVTVFSLNRAPGIDLAPRDILSLVTGLSDRVVDGMLDERRERDTPSIASSCRVEPHDDTPKSSTWHISVVGVSGEARWGRTWVVYIPEHERRSNDLYYLLETWAVSNDDPMHRKLTLDQGSK